MSDPIVLGFTGADLLMLRDMLDALGYGGNVKKFCDDALEHGIKNYRETLIAFHEEKLRELRK